LIIIIIIIIIISIFVKCHKVITSEAQSVVLLVKGPYELRMFLA